MEGWKKRILAARPRLEGLTEGEGMRRLLDLGADRLAAMNKACIDEARIDVVRPNHITFVDRCMSRQSPGGTPSQFLKARPKELGSS